MIKSKSSSRGLEIEDYVFSISENESATIERPLERKRVDYFWWIALLLILSLGARVFYLNVIQGEHYREIAWGNKIRSIVIKAPRGKIFDRFGTTLVNNIPSLDLVFIPADLPKDENAIRVMAGKIASLIGSNEGEIFSKFGGIDRKSFNPILIEEGITQDESLGFLERGQEFPGLMIEKTAVREYIDGSIFSHVIGYVGKIDRKELEANKDYTLTDYTGKEGVEKSYEKILRGVNGAFQVEVDARGNVKKERGIVDPKLGSDLLLTIDAGLQKKIFDSLNQVLEKTGTRTAAAVAINPKNGEVLALVSLPAYDNNLFSGKISQTDYLGLITDPSKPLFNRVIAGEYPPGSTLKPLVAAAALTEGTIDASTSVTCTGAIGVGSYRFGDWKTHGVVDIRKAIAESCDVFFYSLGGGYGNIRGLGMNRMKKYENDFGLGSITGIDIPGEGNGFIPDERWKLDRFGEKWYVGNSYHASIGQGYITTTPLQLANYIAAIANGGTLYQPHVVMQSHNAAQQWSSSEPVVLGRGTVPTSAMDIVRQGMRQTVTGGTAQTLKDLNVAVAGKTGTAQFGSEDKTHAWFVSFAPYDDPVIAMAVLVEGGGEGHSSAVPVTKEVYEWYFNQHK